MYVEACKFSEMKIRNISVSGLKKALPLIFASIFSYKNKNDIHRFFRNNSCHITQKAFRQEKFTMEMLLAVTARFALCSPGNKTFVIMHLLLLLTDLTRIDRRPERL